MGSEGIGEHNGDNSSTASGQSSMEQDVDAKSEGGSSGSGLVISKGGENGSTSIMHLDNEEEQNGDTTSIAKASLKLIEDSNKSSQMARNGYKNIRKKFNWDDMADKYEKKFLEIFEKYHNANL